MAWVAGTRKKALFNFTDRAGRVASVGIWVGALEDDPEGGGVAALRTALVGVSDAACKTTQLLAYAKQDAAVTPGTDAFDRPTDKLKVEAITADGIPVTMQLPSVLAAYYQSDGTTPLTTGPAADLLEAIKTNCVSADGDALQTIKSAQRMIPRGLKSWNRK